MLSRKHAILAVVAAFLLVAPARAADVDKLLPDNAGILITVNVRQMLGSDLMKKHGIEPVKALLKSNEQAQEFLKSIGLDPLTDVADITIAGQGDAEKNDSTLVVVRGKFDKDKIAAKADALAKDDKRLKATLMSGYTVYTVTPDKGADGKSYMSILNGEMVVVSGDAATMGDTLERYTGKKKAAPGKELTQLLGKVDRNQTLWIGALGSGLRKNRIPEEKAKEVINRIDWLTLAVHLGDDVQVKATVNAVSDEAAKALQKDIAGGLESAKGVLALVGDNRPELAPLGEFLDSLKLRPVGTSLVLEGSASAELIGKALKPIK